MSGDRVHEKSLNLKNISKIELTGSANEFDVEYERKKLRMTQFFFGPSNWNPFIGMGNCRMVKFVGGKLSSGWDMLSLNCLLDGK